MRDWPVIAFAAHQAVSIGTFVYLTFFDGYPYNAWNWLIVVPINLFLSEIWFIYWPLLRWLET